MARKPANYPHPTAGAYRGTLDADLMEGFTQVFLLDRYDDPKPIPELHRTLWRMFCSDHPQIAAAAPRGHAKSSACTHAYGLANMVFGIEDFALIVGSSEKMAAAHLADMAVELTENEALIQTFNIKVLINNETELVARCNGREFCIVARGAEQRVRGLKWRQKRPGLILVDDLEEDEAVMNPDRREKLRNWFFNSLLPCGSDRLKVRVVGTILHLDSLLERLLHDTEWLSARFSAHTDYDDFTNILWPEKFNEFRLRRVRQTYINQGNPSGYSQEYLSRPIAQADAYFKKTDLIPMDELDYKKPKVYYAGIDFAVSKKERADNTVIVIGGMDSEGILHIVDVRAGKFSSQETIDQMFELNDLYHPEAWVIENGVISKSIGPFLNEQMLKRGILPLHPMTPTQDKMARARSIQARTRIGGVRYDSQAEWYPAYEGELLSFPRGVHDDRVDATAYLGLCIDKFWNAPTEEEMEEEEWSEMTRDILDAGRSAITGY